MTENKSSKAIDKNLIKIFQLYECYDSDIDILEEIFEKLLGNDYDPNYKITDTKFIYDADWCGGHTILQMIGTANNDLCEILLKHGADCTITDKRGATILLKENTSTEFKNYVDDVRLYGRYKNSYANIILSSQTASENTKNPKDRYGYTHFHAACMYNHVNAVKFFIENGVCINEAVNKDCKFYPGYTALHFAVKSCAVATVKLLLTSGANMFTKDSKGMTPLHLVIVERRKTYIILKRSPNTKQEHCLPHAQKYYKKNKEIINLLLQKMHECGHSLDNNESGLTYFHILCFIGNSSEIKEQLFDSKEKLSLSVSKDSSTWPGYTPLHFAAHSNVETVKLLVLHGADLGAKDANGLTSFDVCLREFPIADVYEILLLQPNYSNIVFSNGKTKLSDFMQAMHEHATFKNFLKTNLTYANMFIPFDSPIGAGYTPLHFVVMCIGQPVSWSSKTYDYAYGRNVDYRLEESEIYASRIKLCLHFNPDVTVRDARGSTPLHWAFRLQQCQAIHHLLERHETSSNYIDEHGLSHLHIACAAKNISMVQKLLSGGSNVNEAVTSNYTCNIETVRTFYFDKFYTYFISKGSTPLHIASIVKCPEVVGILITQGANVLAQDSNGLNPLEILFKVPIFRDLACPKPSIIIRFDENEKEIIKLMVRKIGRKLVNSKPKQMLYCYSLLKNELLSDIFGHNDKSAIKILASVGVTALHIACFTHNLLQVNKKVDKIDVNACVDLDSPLWPGCTPLHLFAKDRLDISPTNNTIIKKLLQSGADVTSVNAKGDTPIHQTFPYSEYFSKKMVNHLKDFNVNAVNKEGITLLHIASSCGAESIVEKLLEHGAEIDQPAYFFTQNHSGSTALHFAAFYQQKNVVDILLKYGADVNWRNAYGGNPLHTANREERRSCLELLRTLILAGADIYARNMYGETPLEALIKAWNLTDEEVKLFLEYGSNVNTINSMTGEGFLALVLNKTRGIQIFNIVLKTPQVMNLDDNGRNAIHSAVSFIRPGYDLFGESTILDNCTPSDSYIQAIESLVKLGLNIDHQDASGSTPLHVAAQMQNLTAIIGLLENGADINVVDANNNPAFVYSWELSHSYKKFKELDLPILAVVSAHICKLNICKIGISMSNREVSAKIRDMQHLETSKVEQYIREIESTIGEEIDSTSITFYEFLSDTGAVSAFPYMSVDKRVAIDSIFKNKIETIREKFPELIGILFLQYRKALARCKLLESAETSLNFLVGFNMPAICSRIILRFLSNDELIAMIDSNLENFNQMA